MCRDERVHEGLEIGSPPLAERIANLPFIIRRFARYMRADRRQPLVQSRLEPFDLVIVWSEVISGAGSDNASARFSLV